jgi:hypothetical protein
MYFEVEDSKKFEFYELEVTELQWLTTFGDACILFAR